MDEYGKVRVIDQTVEFNLVLPGGAGLVGRPAKSSAGKLVVDPAPEALVAWESVNNHSFAASAAAVF